MRGHMRWSKLKQSVEARMAPTLAGRVELHRADYRAVRGPWGRGWITIDQQQVWSCADDPQFAEHARLATQLQTIHEQSGYHDPAYESAHYQAWEEAKSILHQQAIISSGEFDSLLKAYLSLSIDDALHAESPLLRALAMTDARLGKRRLRALATTVSREHPLVKLLYATRCAAEGISANDAQTNDT